MIAKTKLAVFMVAFAALLTELLLIRVLDVILRPDLEYVIITCAMFSLGAAGVYRALWPAKAGQEMRSTAISAILCGIFLIVLRPLFNMLPVSYSQWLIETKTEYMTVVAMYFAVFAIFFCVGLIFISVFSVYSRHVRSLYGWDLLGAASGCFAIIFLVEWLGPGGLLLWAAAMMFISAALFLNQRTAYRLAGAAALICVLLPVAKYPGYYDFGLHLNKREVLTYEQRKGIELTRWDPISKVDIIPILDSKTRKVRKMHVALDGGTCSSYFYPFDGDFAALRAKLEKGEVVLRDHFSSWGVPISHYLKRDQNTEVLVIGSAAGQEIKAALTYGAAHVDAIDLVGTIIDLAKTTYASYIGDIYNHPKVMGSVGEGRSFLQSSHKKYDIIQIYSHSTSSRAAWGHGPLRSEYLMTTEAFEEYFKHLNEDGILHLNYLNYPRQVAVAASAWGKLGRKSFSRHVVVFAGANNDDFLPTVLIKMSPWTEAEIEELNGFLRIARADMPMVENPLQPDKTWAGRRFFAEKFQFSLVKERPYRVAVTTDDRPYFNFQQNYFNYPDKYRVPLFYSSSWHLISEELQYAEVLPYDMQPIIITGGVILACIFLFIVIPLSFSKAARSVPKGSLFIYFACLGMGFVVLELCFIHIFLKLIGFPLYTYSTVIFTMLFAAGLGSLYSERLGISPSRRWSWAFIGILVTGAALILSFPALCEYFLATPVLTRIIVSAALMAPLGFFLGIPFSLGLNAIAQTQAGLAWAWALNSAFTAIGGLLTAATSIVWGFEITMFLALACYALAFVMFPRLQTK